MKLSLTPWGFGRALTPTANGNMFGLHREIDRIFDEFSKGLSTPANADWTPRMNVAETEKEYQVSAELPGVAEKDVEVTFHEGLLTVKGSKKEETEQKDKNFHRMEMSYGSFERSVALPEEIDEEAINASFKNGVLTISIPKKPSPKAETRKIQIKSA
jgi:HSP20 family protein